MRARVKANADRVPFEGSMSAIARINLTHFEHPAQPPPIFIETARLTPVRPVVEVCEPDELERPLSDFGGG